ncbi:MAG: peptidoglycan-binding protein [Acidimicrobiia bacterium]
MGTIDDSVTVRGTVVQAADDLLVPFGEPSVVTGVPPAAGDVITEGDVVLEVDDRPLFVLEGGLPLISDLEPRARGSMVVQLQDAMTRLGWYEGKVDGIYGWSTQQAVRSMYRDAGFTSPVLAAPESPEGADVAATPSAPGTPLVASEVMFLTTLPQTIGATMVDRGSVVDADTAIFSLPQGDTVVQSSLSEADAAPFAVGMTVELRTDDDSIVTTGVVESIEPGEDSADGDLVMSVSLDGDELKSRDGLPVQVSTLGTDVPTGLVVPYTAVRSSGDGVDYVLRRVDAATSERVEVEVVAEGDGFVRIEAVGATLAEGDEVIVGGDG